MENIEEFVFNAPFTLLAITAIFLSWISTKEPIWRTKTRRPKEWTSKRVWKQNAKWTSAIAA